MAKRRLEELNLLDDFLFGTMLNYKGIGESFVRELLRIIMGKEFGDLKIVTQRSYYGSDTDKHGARLDVFVEETGSAENATIYDIEPDKNSRTDAAGALPKRVRFYHAKIDADSLTAGEGYETLKNVIIIMITPFDPFGAGRMIYTIQNKCVEKPDMPYEDGARTLFLYTRGSTGDPPQEIRELLRYMEKTTEENAVSRDLRKIHDMVKQVKQDREVSLEFMKIFEREQMLIRQGRSEMEEELKKERERAEAERKEAQAAREEAENEKKEAQAAREEAENEKKEAQMARDQAEAEKRRAQKAEAELQKLRAELEKLKGGQ